uniref:Homeobox domain-containing protein n=1 Tax=Astyanax mexicanus TaxID=7994 RepID=A0A3B1IUM8_ASTMX
MTKDGEQVQPQLAPSLLSSPVASAQAVSAFLTLLTSSPNSLPHSVHPSLIAAGAGATPSTTPPQLIPQPQMLIPLILNGLQTQSPNPESPKQLLQQTVPVLGLSAAQQALLAQGLSGLQIGVPADGSLIVVQVKPDTAITIPNSSNSTILNCNNLAKTSTVFMRAAEKVSSSMTEKEKESDKMRDPKRSNSRRFRDMRRSRTIIQADQLDVLYGCYFKDPNPGKHEFEQISEWVHLPKKVVQIWFQNMRARERKGEVRFISDGTLAAVGKPLIKFTWPLTKPIFSSTPKSNPSPNSPGWVSPKPQTGIVLPKVERIKEEKEPQKISIQVLNKPKEVASTTVVSSTSAALKPKGEAVTAVTMVKIAPKAVAPAVSVGILSAGSSIARIPPKIQAKTERPEEKDGQDKEKVVPVATHITVPKVGPQEM